MFAQYISHETRGSLNIVMMGLELLMDNLKDDLTTVSNRNCENALAEFEKHQRLHIQRLDEIRESCSLAVTTLNDMLTYDKLDNGMLTLDIEDVNVVALVSGCVNAFNIQVCFDLVWSVCIIIIISF